MEVSQNQILDFVRRRPERALKIRELARALCVPERAYPDFRRLIHQMTRDGNLVKLRNNRYGTPGDHNLAMGMLSVHTSGHGLISRDDGGPDIFIGASNLGQAMHGDHVMVRLTKGPINGNRPEGELMRIVEQAEQTVVGTFRESDPPSVVSDDPRFPADVLISPGQTADAQDGQKVVARIHNRTGPHPEGRIVEILGDPNAPGIETLVLIKKHGLPLEFPPHVIESAETAPTIIPPSEMARRQDLRQTVCVTIDPFDARDHDDAVSLEEYSNGTYLLGVHIADVSHYVAEGSPLDHEALSRGTSVYLPDRVIPMLPERLSGDICSLRPNEDRLALSVLIHICPDGRILSANIAETVICSHARLNYDDVQKVLDDRADARKTHAFPFATLLKKMEALRRHLTDRRKGRGAIDFDLPEPRIYLDPHGFPADIRTEPRLNSHRLIEEFMLLANETVAQFMTDRGVPILYRVHEPPDPEKLSDFAMLAATFGYRLPKPNRLGPADIQHFLETVQNERIGRVLNNRLLRSLKKACYTPKNQGHFGLACPIYTHFTSPIRRYPDLVVHRIVRDTLTNQRNPEREERRNKRLPDIGDMATGREIAAQNAEWDAIRLMQILYLKDKIGEHFSGTIVDVRGIGFFVQIDEVLVEGLVHVSSLEDDYYIFYDRRGALIGERTGKCYQIGDAVEVLLVQTDKQRLRIDFQLINHAQKKIRAKHIDKKQPKRNLTRHPARKKRRR